jgi:preflagellin peptidase FlaK
MALNSTNVRNSSWNLANILFYPAAFLAVTPFFINRLGENVFGEWMLINSYVYIAVHLVGFGLPVSITAHVAEAIGRWYFILIILIYVVTSLLMLFGQEGWGTPALLVLLSAVFCGVFYTFGRMHLFGGADAWALVFISLCIPTFPFTPLFGNPPLGFLAFSVLINALLLNLAAPLGIFVINMIRGNRAPPMYLFFGFPVKGDEIQKEWGFVMEDFEENKGTITRKFIGFWDAIRRMYAGEGRIYTKELREHPENFTRELEMYRKAGTVWISYAVPFIIPIAAGLISAIIFGDFLFAIMKLFVKG